MPLHFTSLMPQEIPLRKGVHVGVCVLPRFGVSGNVSVLIGMDDVFHAGALFSVGHCGSISALIPRRSPVLGGILITVHGSGFTPSSAFKCSFGWTTVIANFASVSEVICVSPTRDVRRATCDVRRIVAPAPFPSPPSPTLHVTRSKSAASAKQASRLSLWECANVQELETNAQLSLHESLYSKY